MWWSDVLLLPRWLTGVLAVVAASGAGFVAAIAAFWLLAVVEFGGLGGGTLLVASLVHPEVVAVAAAGCGVAIGVATASGLPHGAAVRRAAATAALLLLLGVAAVGAFLVASDAAERDFSAERFRDAAAKQDLDTLEAEARKAVRARALIGMSTAQVRRQLGPPSRVGRRRQLYIWDLGMINDFAGPGDAGALYVKFDRPWRHVRSAQVAYSGM
jgi:hypothetical protein